MIENCRAVYTTKKPSPIFLLVDTITLENISLEATNRICKKDVRRYSLKCRVTNQWNNLPEAIVTALSLNTFNNRLEKLWERDGVMFDPDVNLYTTASNRRTRYARINPYN